MRYKQALSAGALALAVVLTGCSNNSDDNGEPGSSSTTKDFNKTDVSFAQDMIPHHRQAVEMADLAETRASDPKVKKLAAQIAGAQDPEIETMTGWLKDWDQKVPADHSGMDMSSSMPGMMSTKDMAKLEASTGPGFDTQFLTMMAAHHKGAIEMAKTEQSDGKYAEAVALAKQIESAQTGEIKTIESLLQS